MPSFYQDRLGTNIGKALSKKERGAFSLLLQDGVDTPLHRFSATAKVPSTLFYIDRSAALRVMYQHPRVKTGSRTMIMQKLTRWQKSAEQAIHESHSSSSSLGGGAAASSSGGGGGGDGDGGGEGFGKSMHEYVPTGLLPLPVFSHAGQLVEEEDAGAPPRGGGVDSPGGAAAAAAAAAAADVDRLGTDSDADSLARVRSDVRRLEGKVDQLLDLMRRA
jgi:hypothetical protein